jgi:hypothetical protein
MNSVAPLSLRPLFSTMQGKLRMFRGMGCNLFFILLVLICPDASSLTPATNVAVHDPMADVRENY